VRLPFPERVPFKSLVYFAAALCALQLFERTNPTFALCCFFFVLIAGVAFNIGGGMTHASGAYIFFFSVLGVILGLCWKAFLGEPADSNLQVPLLTIYIYLAGISMMLVAVYLSRKVTRRHALLGNILPDYKIQTAMIGCTVTAFLLASIERLAPSGSGSFVSGLKQINHFFPLAIVLGVIHTIRRTGGRSSVSPGVLICGCIMFYDGLIGFSKEGMLAPIACYVIAAASQGYRFSKVQIAAGILGVVFIFRYLVPYAQIGRNYRGNQSEADTVKIAYTLMTNLGQLRQEYLESSVESYDLQLYRYFDTPQGFFDRLQMISIDDALNQNTEQFGTFGTLPLLQAFENIIPHFIWKNKPALSFGNTFAHQIGILGQEDTSTGISFTSVSTAFHMAGWTGIFVIAPPLWFILFCVFDSICGDVRRTPWGLVVLAIFGHTGPEGDLPTIIYMFSVGAFGIALASILTAYLMPIIGTFFIGPEGVGLKPRAPVRSIPRRLLPASEIESPAT